MRKTLNRTIVMAAAGLVSMQISNLAVAHWGYGGSCTNCHSAPGLALTISPNPINIQKNNHGLLTFQVTSVGISNETAISVQGLENALLNATVNPPPAGGNWTYFSDSRGMSWQSDIISSTGPYTLDLGIGASATTGTYPITVMFAGDRGSGSQRLGLSTTFNLTIGPAGVPGDYNGNGKVDAADYVMWRNDPSAFGGDPAGYNTWRANFGKTAASGSVTSAAIPEPATLATLLVGTVAMMLVLARTSSPRCCRRS